MSLKLSLTGQKDPSQTTIIVRGFHIPRTLAISSPATINALETSTILNVPFKKNEREKIKCIISAKIMFPTVEDVPKTSQYQKIYPNSKFNSQRRENPSLI